MFNPSFKSKFDKEVVDYSKLEKSKSLFGVWKKKQDFLTLCAQTSEAFQAVMKQHGFQTSGTFYAECHAFLTMCKLLDVDVILESGMSRGNSTEIWAKNFHGKIVTFENMKQDYHDDVVNRLSPYDIDINFEDSNRGFKQKLKQLKDSRVAVFIDGPKDVHAVQLALESFKFSNVLFVGIHDVANPITKCRAHYGFMKYFKYHVLSTDELEFREKFAFLDDDISDPDGAWVYNESGVSSHSSDPKAILERFPQGPGIGIALNQNLNLDDQFNL